MKLFEITAKDKYFKTFVKDLLDNRKTIDQKTIERKREQEEGDFREWWAFVIARNLKIQPTGLKFEIMTDPELYNDPDRFDKISKFKKFIKAAKISNNEIHEDEWSRIIKYNYNGIPFYWVQQYPGYSDNSNEYFVMAEKDVKRL